MKDFFISKEILDQKKKKISKEIKIKIEYILFHKGKT